MRSTPIIVTFLALSFSGPALADSGTPVPEPSNVALFGLGLLGLIVGRMAARRRSRRDGDRQD